MQRPLAAEKRGQSRLRSGAAVQFFLLNGWVPLHRLRLPTQNRRKTAFLRHAKLTWFQNHFNFATIQIWAFVHRTQIQKIGHFGGSGGKSSPNLEK